MVLPIAEGRPRTEKTNTMKPTLNNEAIRTISTEAIKIAHDSLPKGLRLTSVDVSVIGFIDLNPTLPYAKWPKAFKRPKQLKKLSKKGTLSRKERPTRYGLTRSGYGLASWIRDAIEYGRARVDNANMAGSVWQAHRSADSAGEGR